MTDIVVDDLRKTFKARDRPMTAMDDVSFRVGEGEMLVMLGPSGCGKTTTLRCLAGLEEPDAGTIAFGGRTIWDERAGINVQIHRRDIGLVFQTFALWPHLSAGGNIEFPLRQRHVPKGERTRLVAEIAALVDLDPSLLDKAPGQLSGGQQQRVALSRALIAKPSVVLFDEPLSNLDTLLREQLRTELHVLHRRLGFTGVYVTHDLTEALSLGDKVAAMRLGRMEQIGTPVEVFERPSDHHIARLVGFRRLCALTWSDGRWVGENAQVSGDLTRIGVGANVGRVTAFSRPDRLHPCRPDDAATPNVRIAGGIVREHAYLGERVELVVVFGTREIRMFVPEQVASVWRVGDPVAAEVPMDALRFYDDDGRPWRQADSLVPDASELTASS